MRWRSSISFWLIALFALYSSGIVNAQVGTNSPTPALPQGQSLADIARKLRKDNTNEVRMNAEDTKKLFAAVDVIFAFAVADTGMPKRAVVKRQLVGKGDVEKSWPAGWRKKNSPSASLKGKAV